ncbi:uncharacterized protein [Ptychodera flava]|uniref:uncharacterized protein n=1 Tax=Ptychodera flava TaxID=63121 RepID=UPI00396A889A
MAAGLAPLRKLYYNLNNELGEEEFNNLKVLVGDKIDTRLHEKLETPAKWFQQLETHGYISEDDLTLLKSLFGKMKQPKLVTMVVACEEELKSMKKKLNPTTRVSHETPWVIEATKPTSDFHQSIGTGTAKAEYSEKVGAKMYISQSEANEKKETLPQQKPQSTGSDRKTSPEVKGPTTSQAEDQEGTGFKAPFSSENFTEHKTEGPLGALFVTSWKEHSFSQDNWKLITAICENILSTQPSEFSEVYCTFLDVELSEQQKEDAARYGVTLIPAAKQIWCNSHADQPAITWLFCHQVYYPLLGNLQENIHHVIPVSLKTKEVASFLHEKLFHSAKLHQPPDQPAAAVFIYDAWSDDELGLTGFHRTIIQDFCKRKAKAGEDLKAYSTVLDIKISDDQKKDAESCGVTLIPGQRKDKTDQRDDPSKLEWLLNHEIYYPKLKELENVQYVIGYAPKTGRAAADIKGKLFPSAKLILINHACPETDCLQAEEYGLLKFEEKMLQMASDADIIFSIGPCIYDYFQNAYGAEVQGRDLSDIPHEEILPRPDTCFWVKNPKERQVTRHHILTCGQMDTHKAIEGCKSIAASIGTVANTLKKNYKRPTEWKIQGVSEQASKTEQKILSDASESQYVNPKFQPGHSTKSLLTSLQQSHICLPSPCYWDYSFYGLEAMAFGLPTAVNEDSHLAHFVMKYLEMHVNDCVVRTGKGKLPEKILQHLEETPVAFKKAKAVKTALKLMNCEAVTQNFAKFASLLNGPGHKESEKSCKDQEAKHLPVKVALDEEMLQKCLTKLLEERTHWQALSVQLRQLQERVKTAWGECEQGLKRRVQAVLADEDSCNEVKKVCTDKVDLDPTTVTADSLGILLKIVTLYYLYRVKQTCRSGSLAKALEPLLITDEMREIAAGVGIKLQLKATYNTVKFEEIELFFINRDGGGVQSVTFHEDIEDNDSHANLDSKGEEPPLSEQASDQVVVTASDQVDEQLPQTKLEQKLEEKLVTHHGKPTQPITAGQESQAGSILPIQPSKQQLTDSDIRYLASDESKVQSLQSQLDKPESKIESLQSQLYKACTEKKILETELAEAVHEKSQLEKQCQEYIQRCHSAEKIVGTQLSGIHALASQLENLQTKLKEQNKVITELKTKLTQLSDAQSDIELQKKIEESLQLCEQIITSEMVHKETTMASVDDIYTKSKSTEIEKEDPTQPENIGKKGFEMKTATSSQPEIAVRERHEVKTVAMVTTATEHQTEKSDSGGLVSRMVDLDKTDGNKVTSGSKRKKRDSISVDVEEMPSGGVSFDASGAKMVPGNKQKLSGAATGTSESEELWSSPVSSEMSGGRVKPGGKQEQSGKETADIGELSSGPMFSEKMSSGPVTPKSTKRQIGSVTAGSEAFSSGPVYSTKKSSGLLTPGTRMSSGPQSSEKKSSGLLTPGSKKEQHGSVTTAGSGELFSGPVSSKEMSSGQVSSKKKSSSPVTPGKKEQHRSVTTAGSGELSTDSDSSKKMSSSPVSSDKKSSSPVTPGSKKDQHGSVTTAGSGVSSKEMSSGPVSSEKISSGLVTTGSKKEQRGSFTTGSGELSAGSQSSKKMSSGQVTPRRTKGQSGSGTTRGKELRGGPGSSEMSGGTVIHTGRSTGTKKKTGSDGDGSDKTRDHSKSKKEIHGGTATARSQHGHWSRRTLKGHQGHKFKYVRGLAFHNNKLLVCDRDNNIVHILNKDYTCEKELGSFSGQFAKPFQPKSIAVSQDNLYFILDDSNVQIVVCNQNNKVIRIITLPTNSDPWCIALVKGFVIVTEVNGHRVLKYSQTGQYIAECLGGQQDDRQTPFNNPYFVAVNSKDVIMVSDCGNHCIKCFDAQFNFLYQYGHCGHGDSQLYWPHSIAVDGADHVYVCDYFNNRISIWSEDRTCIDHLFHRQVSLPWYIAVTADGDRIAVRGYPIDEIHVFSK